MVSDGDLQDFRGTLDMGLRSFNNDKSSFTDVFSGTGYLYGPPPVFWGDRGLSAAGQVAGSSPSNVIEYWDITLNSGNASDFGDLTAARNYPAPSSNGSRGLVAAGGPYGSISNIDYITFSTTGNASDFGDTTVARYGLGQGTVSSGVRGVFAGGYSASGYENVIDYVTIDTTGNAQDFGDLTHSSRYMGACSSMTRGLWGGAYNPSSCSAGCNYIDYVTIATTGNATDFGNLTDDVYRNQGCASETRGLFGGGQSPSTNVIEYVTIDTTGNATDFGDLTQAMDSGAATSNNTRGVFVGGGGAVLNRIDYVTIDTTGNATDYGDLTQDMRDNTALAGT